MGPMVSLIKRLHCTCIKDRQCGPNGVEGYTTILLHASLNMAFQWNQPKISGWKEHFQIYPKSEMCGHQ